jgi:hypothetical protein
MFLEREQARLLSLKFLHIAASGDKPTMEKAVSGAAIFTAT